VAKRSFSPKQLAAQRRFAAAVARGPIRKGAKLGASTQGPRKSSVAKPSRTKRIASRARRAGSALNQRVNLKRQAIRGAAGAVSAYSPMVAGEFGPGATMAIAGTVAKDDLMVGLGAISLGAAAARAVGGAAGYSAPASGRLA
jgi:hypothetical protein